jgi:hypothetical protein
VLREAGVSPSGSPDTPAMLAGYNHLSESVAWKSNHRCSTSLAKLSFSDFATANLSSFVVSVDSADGIRLRRNRHPRRRPSWFGDRSRRE